MYLVLTISLFWAAFGPSQQVCHCPREWWKDSVSYQIYPRSFKDSDGDGIGDLNGIREMLHYISYIGVDLIWISPFYTSPMKDFGYDVSNFTDVDPMFGTLKDFDDLLAAAHKRGMKIILDFIPNHSSNQHIWFQKSLKKEEPYTDYYVWKDGDPNVVPNNWLSVFGQSPWTWYPERNQWNYHAFTPEQPDLNYENPLVKEDMKNVLRFWLDRGVDGFRYDAIVNILEDQRYLDEPRSFKPDARPGEHAYLKHIYTEELPAIKYLLKEFSDVVKSYEVTTGRDKILFCEAYVTLEESMSYYEISDIDLPYNLGLIDLTRNCTAKCFATLVKNWMEHMTRDRWPNWVTSNHDRYRLATRLGEDFLDALHMLFLLLPGTPQLYYGDELGMQNIEVSYEDTQDPWGKNYGPERYTIVSRDPERSPMQWNSSFMAGFTTANKSWLPIHPDYVKRNAEDQMKDMYSHLNIFRALMHLRKYPSFRDKNMVYGPLTDNIYSFGRTKNGERGFFIILNLGHQAESYPYDMHPSSMKDHSSKVVLFTRGLESKFHIGSDVDLNDLKLSPGEGVVLTGVYKSFVPF